MGNAADEWVPVIDTYGKVRYLKHKRCKTMIVPSLKDRCGRCPSCGHLMSTTMLERYNSERTEKALRAGVERRKVIMV